MSTKFTIMFLSGRLRRARFSLPSSSILGLIDGTVNGSRQARPWFELGLAWLADGQRATLSWRDFFLAPWRCSPITWVKLIMPRPRDRPSKAFARHARLGAWLLIFMPRRQKRRSSPGVGSRAHSISSGRWKFSPCSTAPSGDMQLLERSVDAHLRHQLYRRDRRHQPVSGFAHDLAHADRDPRVLVGARQSQRVFDLHAAAGDRHARRFCRAGSFSLLCFLGSHAGADVFSNRRVGRDATHLCRAQIRRLHDGGQPAHVGGDHLSGDPPRADRASADFRSAANSTDSHLPPGEQMLALSRLRSVVRDQGAAVSLSHLAAGRSRRSADGGLGDPCRRAARSSAPTVFSVSPCRCFPTRLSRQRRSLWLWPWSASFTARWWR